MKQFKFMRACYGIAVCFGIGITVSMFTRPETFEKQRGLVWGTIQDALKNFKGSAGSEESACKILAVVQQGDSSEPGPSTSDFPVVQLSRQLADGLSVASGDLIYVSDRRWWLGGLRSSQCRVGEVFAGDADQAVVVLEGALYKRIVVAGRQDQLLLVERLY